MKRIVICSDGTWNKPEENIEEDFPTNVLQFSRGIKPNDKDNTKQLIFYDWGIGSYHNSASGGAFGAGLDKNVQDAYRFIVHNYEPDDELFFFGFSRGAYTVRSLCGLINNCGILKSEHGNRIAEAYNIYRNRDIHPDDQTSIHFRKSYSHRENQPEIKFVGVWDTVGSLGIPVSAFSFINDKHLFHDQKIGSLIKTARHALALDELRDDFKPTIWDEKKHHDMKQVWFAGVHCDIGGSYEPDEDKSLLATIPMQWIASEAEKKGLAFDEYIFNFSQNPKASIHNEYKGMFRFLGEYKREIPPHTLVHPSVRQRYDSIEDYRPYAIEKWKEDNNGNWPPEFSED